MTGTWITSSTASRLVEAPMEGRSPDRPRSAGRPTLHKTQAGSAIPPYDKRFQGMVNNYPWFFSKSVG